MLTAVFPSSNNNGRSAPGCACTHAPGGWFCRRTSVRKRGNACAWGRVLLFQHPNSVRTVAWRLCFLQNYKIRSTWQTKNDSQKEYVSKSVSRFFVIYHWGMFRRPIPATVSSGKPPPRKIQCSFCFAVWHPGFLIGEDVL